MYFDSDLTFIGITALENYAVPIDVFKLWNDNTINWKKKQKLKLFPPLRWLVVNSLEAENDFTTLYIQ